jgi:hypothetical protein
MGESTHTRVYRVINKQTNKHKVGNLVEVTSYICTARLPVGRFWFPLCVENKH